MLVPSDVPRDVPPFESVKQNKPAIAIGFGPHHRTELECMAIYRRAGTDSYDLEWYKRSFRRISRAIKASDLDAVLASFRAVGVPRRPYDECAEYWVVDGGVELMVYVDHAGLRADLAWEAIETPPEWQPIQLWFGSAWNHMRSLLKLSAEHEAWTAPDRFLYP